jgi:hypothetical protein
MLPDSLRDRELRGTHAHVRQHAAAPNHMRPILLHLGPGLRIHQGRRPTVAVGDRPCEVHLSTQDVDKARNRIEIVRVTSHHPVLLRVQLLDLLLSAVPGIRLAVLETLPPVGVPVLRGVQQGWFRPCPQDMITADSGQVAIRWKRIPANLCAALAVA